MPRKIQRSGSSALVPSSGITVPAVKTTDVALITKATTEVYTTTVKSVASAIKSLAECGQAYFSYLEECERTNQIRYWSEAVISEAREQTRRIEVQGAILLRQLDETRSTREARMEVVRKFLEQHHQLHENLLLQNTQSLKNMSIEERTHLNKFRDDMLQRLRDLESAIASLTMAL